MILARVSIKKERSHGNNNRLLSATWIFPPLSYIYVTLLVNKKKTSYSFLLSVSRYFKASFVYPCTTNLNGSPHLTIAFTGLLYHVQISLNNFLLFDLKSDLALDPSTSSFSSFLIKVGLILKFV